MMCKKKLFNLILCLYKMKKKILVLFVFLGVWINLIDKNLLCYIYFGVIELD